MSPPFRDKKNQDDLWNGLRAGSLQVVATDHCAFTTKQKEFGRDDFTKIPNGTGGLEDRMPVLWTYGVGTGRLTPNEFVAATSTNIARILNLYPRKGAILPGRTRTSSLDPKAEKTITAANATIGHRLQRVRGLQGHGPAALHAVARLRSVRGRTRARQQWARTLHQARAVLTRIPPRSPNTSSTPRPRRSRAHEHGDEAQRHRDRRRLADLSDQRRPG